MNDLLTLDALALTHGPTAPREFAAQLTGSGKGRALVRFTDPGDHQRNLELALGLLSSLGPVLSVYPDDGCWSDLSVRTDVDPGRTHGTGENRLHVDLVDRAESPRYIALYCVRADPAGGGASALSDLWAAAEALTLTDRNLLSQPVFRYFADEGVHGVGESLPQFAVLPQCLDGHAPIRFTSKMLPHLQRGELLTSVDHAAPSIAEAFSRLVDAAHQYRATVRLAPGELLVFDQWRYAHGRMPLGAKQDALPLQERRLLKQTYVAPGGAR
ncbi:TauD/TfdA family dioxygenase [Streptomyces caniscabiei]|uniref:TauD/TfdA family dioxygenase n=1 Tax=Streptomyces caniscabiei TaxID=2746961 RepID=UPI000A36EAF9|nr:TauD/TfdA family dioxygenase [Streptomyces caniscabiei]